MRYLAVAAVAALALGLGGCTFLDWMAGVNPDGTPRDGASPAGVVGTVVNYAIPGAGAVIGGLTTLWAALRARSWKTAFTATAQVIEAGVAAGRAASGLKKELAVAHSAAGVGGLVKKVVEKIHPPLQPARIEPEIVDRVDLDQVVDEISRGAEVPPAIIAPDPDVRRARKPGEEPPAAPAPTPST